MLTHMYDLYILLNETNTRTYTGVTKDVETRVKAHNQGKVISSRPYRPDRIVHTQAFETLSEARQAERFYKSTTGRRRLQQMLLASDDQTS